MKVLSAARIAQVNENTRRLLDRNAHPPAKKLGWPIPEDRLLGACAHILGFESREDEWYRYLYRGDHLVAQFSAFTPFDDLVRAMQLEAKHGNR